MTAMVNCRGCGRKGFKHSGINLHCHMSYNPHCREYLETLKQVTSIRSRQMRSSAEHSPMLTLNVSPSTGEVSVASNGCKVSKKRTIQMVLEDNLEIITSKRGQATTTATTSWAGQRRVCFGLTSTIPPSMQGKVVTCHSRIS